MFLFACPKRNAKRAPGCAGPSGYLVLLTGNGTLKNSASPQTVLTSYSVTSCDAQRHRTGLTTNILIRKKFFTVSRSRAAQQRTDQRLGGAPDRVRLSDVARSLRAAQGSPTQSDQVTGCTFFWFVFFGQAKKMNIYI